jgi:hypothetical protein
VWQPGRLANYRVSVVFEGDFLYNINSYWWVMSVVEHPGNTNRLIDVRIKLILIVACDLWAADEKVRPYRLVIKGGSLPDKRSFYLGMECNPK